MEDFEIEEENHRIHSSLRELNQEVTLELTRSMQRAAHSPTRDPTNQQLLLGEHQKNNLKAIDYLTRKLKSLQERKEHVLGGLEEQTTDEKYRIMEDLSSGRSEMKQLKLDIKELEKDLIVHEERDVPYCQELMEKLEEELRICSSKYTNYLKRYHISEDQLLSIVPAPPVYLNTNVGAMEVLEKREADQYKEYLNIVKLSEILLHRNESDLNKYSRQYGIRIKELDAIMGKLSEAQGQLASRELQILQTKKQVQIMKLRIGESAQHPRIASMEGALRRNSYSMKNIAARYEQRIAQMNEIDEVQRRSTNKISSTERYAQRAFPMRKKSTLINQNYFELEPIKARIGRTSHIVQQTH